MRILFVSHISDINGAPKSMVSLIMELKRYGVESYVVIPEHGKLEEVLKSLHIKYFIANYKPNYYSLYCKRKLYQRLMVELYNVKSILFISKIIRRLHIDIVHSNSFSVDVGAVAAFISRCPHVWHIREFMQEDYSLINNFMKKDIWLAKKSRQIISVSNAIRDKYKNEYGLTNIRTVYNGFNIEEYRNNKDNLFSNKTLNLLISGYICKGKGHKDALLACEKLLQSGCNNFVLYIAGNGDEFYITYLKDLISKTGLINNVRFIGFQNDMKMLRESIDVELVCSVAEAFGRVTIEAMLSDVLVIGADTGGTKELIQDGITGLLYQQSNYNDLAAKLKKVYINRDAYSSLVVNAKKYATENFSIARTASGVMKTYKRIYK